ncbi:MAG: hypothetical protein M1569_03995 [Candidatus Marsarchaeota archaeon]|nr:hypothetical protein [Candidatus Marsarchaeota archaeon]MCL5413534.1 hypothetical protein [Candidatus Marsarchaeota archaeon]
MMLFGIVFSAAIDTIILFSIFNGKISHENMRKLSMPLALFLLILLMYKAVAWTI